MNYKKSIGGLLITALLGAMIACASALTIIQLVTTSGINVLQLAADLSGKPLDPALVTKLQAEENLAIAAYQTWSAAPTATNGQKAREAFALVAQDLLPALQAAGVVDPQVAVIASFVANEINDILNSFPASGKVGLEKPVKFDVKGYKSQFNSLAKGFPNAKKYELK